MSGSYVKSKNCLAALRSAGEHSRTDPGSGRRPAGYGPHRQRGNPHRYRHKM
jgi:hypothetical protein